MKIRNHLPLLLACLKRWKGLPPVKEFEEAYFRPLEPILRPMLEDWGIDAPEAFHAELEGLDWAAYRTHALGLDPEQEEKRVRTHARRVEELLGVKLGGEAVLFGAFEMMDGYARFDRGSHRVFLGVDEDPGHDQYLDVLISHELTHVARETQPSVWDGFGPDSGLSLAMTHDEFTERLPVIEHLFNEGFSCAVSELLLPGLPPWLYVYQTEESLKKIIAHATAVDKVVHEELRKSDGGDYGNLYNTMGYRPKLPLFCHYVWAWHWAKRVIATEGHGNPGELLGRCSGEFSESARGFRLAGVLR
ncbi:MAG: hypothetical protein NDJ89_11865 [Oligoflexia bacterium]|nr:hypothetical protein [Oligoflexia bacterium]